MATITNLGQAEMRSLELHPDRHTGGKDQAPGPSLTASRGTLTRSQDWNWHACYRISASHLTCRTTMPTLPTFLLWNCILNRLKYLYDSEVKMMLKRYAQRNLWSTLSPFHNTEPFCFVAFAEFIFANNYINMYRLRIPYLQCLEPEVSLHFRLFQGLHICKCILVMFWHKWNETWELDPSKNRKFICSL